MKRGAIVGHDAFVVTSATAIICVASLVQSRGKSGGWSSMGALRNK